MCSWRATAALVSLLVGCGGAAYSDTTVVDDVGGVTFVFEDVEPYVDLMAVGECFAEELLRMSGTHTATTVMVIVTPNTKPSPEPGKVIRGIYHARENAIWLARWSRYLWDTSYAHELFQHRLPHLLTGDPNGNHKPEWEGKEIEARRNCARKLSSAASDDRSDVGLRSRARDM